MGTCPRCSDSTPASVIPDVNNVRSAQWKNVFRIFFPDDEANTKSSKTAPVPLMVTLMDYNKKTADVLIGEVEVSLQAGSGRVKVEIPSRCVSSCRPMVYFQYTATAQMYFEKTEWVRTVAMEGDEAEDESEMD